MKLNRICIILLSKQKLARKQEPKIDTDRIISNGFQEQKLDKFLKLAKNKEVIKKKDHHRYCFNCGLRSSCLGFIDFESKCLFE